MKLKFKFNSITARWFFNVFMIVAIILTIVVVVFSVMYRSFYIERIETLANDMAHEFNSLSSSSKAAFADNAISLAGDFTNKNNIEIQVIDREDNIVVTTTGFQPSRSEMPDYVAAKESGTAVTYMGKTSEKEPILSCTNPLYDSNGRYIGAYRWTTSLNPVNKTVRNFVFILVLVALGALAFLALSGLFFIKSIVQPIQNVSNMAKRIAMGDFESRIELKNNDEIGELCDTINYMASELHQADNIKNDFISSVSHELRTPLTAIRGWGETAKMSLGTDEELVKRGIDVVLSEADRLSGLVEELLDFSRMQTGKLSVVSAPLNITFLLSESVDMYYELARRQGIELVFTRPQEEVTVMGDINRLKQVFINIVDNAVKYTESGGQVLVDQITEEACVRISVKDTGVGIPAQDIDRVKEKFYKANKKVRGSGIGLAVADEIIKQHQGLLFVESTEGVGTTVTIVLPLYEPEEEPDLTDEEEEKNG